MDPGSLVGKCIRLWRSGQAGILSQQTTAFFWSCRTCPEILGFSFLVAEDIGSRSLHLINSAHPLDVGAVQWAGNQKKEVSDDWGRSHIIKMPPSHLARPLC